MKKSLIPSTVRTIFLDMNNTMIDPERSFDQCFRNILVDFTGRWESDEQEATPEKAVELYLAEWQKRKKKIKPSSSGSPNAAINEIRKMCLKASLKHYPFAVNDAFVQSFFREMKKQQRQYAVLFPHTAETVRELAKHYQLGIISNGSKDVQEEMIERFGLSAELPRERIFTSKKGEYRKPDSAIFMQALKATSTEPAHAAMVGDSWSNDIAGALKCGMNAIWLNKHNSKKITQRKVGKKKIVVIRQFHQLRDLFDGQT
ncbi:MAG: phosphatase-like protein [Paenibacillus sp.]|jgi:putative hydrolase of the HAD superfamily|nr:phosphatase-like protein [Paenibacillus sp.]